MIYQVQIIKECEVRERFERILKDRVKKDELFEKSNNLLIEVCKKINNHSIDFKKYKGANVLDEIEILICGNIYAFFEIKEVRDNAMFYSLKKITQKK